MVVFRLPGVVLGDAGSVGATVPPGESGSGDAVVPRPPPLMSNRWLFTDFLYVLLLKTVRQVSPFIVLVPELPLNVTLLT